jgi:hypothetical protein
MAGSINNGTPQMNAKEREFSVHLRPLRLLRPDAFASIAAKESA